MIQLKPLGDRAFLAQFGFEREARDWADSVRLEGWAGVVEVSVAYASAAVYLDPDLVDPVELEARLRAVEPLANDRAPGRLITIPVLYDGEDLHEVAHRLGLTELEVAERHAQPTYDVFAIGFLPGFAYCGYLEPPLSGLPRRSTPRPRVEAGSVAIAGRQTGIYPASSPGGWLILGRTPWKIVDLARGYFPIRAGDRIQFKSIDEQEFRDEQGQLVKV